MTKRYIVKGDVELRYDYKKYGVWGIVEVCDRGRLSEECRNRLLSLEVAGGINNVRDVRQELVKKINTII